MKNLSLPKSQNGQEPFHSPPADVDLWIKRILVRCSIRATRSMFVASMGIVASILCECFDMTSASIPDINLYPLSLPEDALSSVSRSSIHHTAQPFSEHNFHQR